MKDVEFDMGKLIWYVILTLLYIPPHQLSFAVDNSVTFETYYFSPLAIMTVGTTHCAKIYKLSSTHTSTFFRISMLTCHTSPGNWG